MQRNTTINETGRSMVEMLSVLAIMALLSVIALYGYRIAVNKVQANELLNEANKRAVVVAGQIQLNSNSASLNEFTQNEFNYGTFDTAPVSAQNGQFKIQINNVPSEICASVKSAAGGIVQDFFPATCPETDTMVLLTYNNDLSWSPTTGNNNTSTSGSAREPLPEDGPTTDDNSTCSGERKGECQVCNNGTYIDSDAYCLAHGGGACINGECKALGCTSNGDCRTIDPTNCGNGECYCNVFTGVNAYTGPTQSGTCMLKSAHFSKEVMIDNHIYTYGSYAGSGGKTLDWWSSKNFCASYGKRMMTLAEAQNLSNGLNTLSGYATWFLDLANDHQAPFIAGGGRFYSGVNRNDGYSCVLCY